MLAPNAIWAGEFGRTVQGTPTEITTRVVLLFGLLEVVSGYGQVIGKTDDLATTLKKI